MKRLWIFPALLSGWLGCARKETVATYPEGQPKLVREYAFFGPKDSLHVRKATAYFLNGKPEYEEHLRNGIRDGIYKAYWQNGQIQSQGRYAQGRREGEWDFSYNRYTLSAKGRYRDDSADGLWTEYWENGELKRRGTFRMGREIGEWVGWNSRGVEVLRSSCFESNAQGHYRSCHDNGAVDEEYHCRQARRVGAYAANHPEGTPKRRGFYDSTGAEDSLWESFHPDGRLASRRHFHAGLWNDSVLAWDDSGRIVEKGFFRNGTGILRRYDSTGRVLEVLPMLAGRENGEHWKYYPDGQKKMVTVFTNGTPLSLRHWHSNGVLSAEGAYVAGHKFGLWQEWDERHRLRESAHYEDGELHGERRFFDSTGTVTRVQKYYRGIPTEGSFPGLPGGVKRKP